MAKKKLNVVETTNIELASKWGVDFSPSLKGRLFIRCNAKGEVNWGKALVYNFSELLIRGNVNIIKR